MYNNQWNSLITAKSFRTKRISSYDVTGGNNDAWRIQPGETKVIASLKGPGIISHIWVTIWSRYGENDPRVCDPLTLRKVLIRVYWDDEENPSIYSPIGDFFGLGHSRAYTYQCAAFSTSCNTGIEGKLSSRVAMNCWLPMPFIKSARVEIINEQIIPITMYFYIDYQEHNLLPEDVVYLHARWRRENPCKASEGKDKGINLSDTNNYLILEAEGRGHYIGTNMSINNLQGGWWGEGDDMIFIDRDGERVWPPDMHGTGSEDYFCHAWGMQKVAHLYCGQPWCEIDDRDAHIGKGKVCVYRYHIVDPIIFQKNIRVSIEHGHANDRSDDWSSVAYWYQDEPHKEFSPMLPVDERLP
ncbi:MAG: DUF2961 domain-containing protein [Firmicutes bacterium]|nr:DUF2961 domain-containing protein [Bacillota bacterium]